MKLIYTILACTFVMLLGMNLHLASALTITNVEVDVLHPGDTGNIIIDVENSQDNDVKDVSLSLDLANLPLSAVGSSEDNIDKIDSDDDGKFSFSLRASSAAKPGDYNVPYTLTYDGLQTPRKGLIGVKITAKPQLDYSLNINNPIVGEQGKIELRIINKGLADAKFVLVNVQPEGYTLLSENQVYIGKISSDDFELASFDVIFKNQKPNFIATLEYLDFDNKKIEQNLEIPIKVYTKERAIELGILKKSNASLYISIVIVIIVLWIIYRMIKKRRRMKKSMQMAEKGEK